MTRYVVDGVADVCSVRRLVRRRNGDTWAVIDLPGSNLTAMIGLAAAWPLPLDRDALSILALGHPAEGARAVDQLVHQIRRKLPPDQFGRPIIESIRGVGYRIRGPVVEETSV